MVRSVVWSMAQGPVWSVVWSVVRFVGWSMVQSVVRSVQSVVLLHTPYNGRPVSDAWTSFAQAAGCGFCTVWCVSAVLRKGCGGVAGVRSVVPVDGLAGGPVVWSGWRSVSTPVSGPLVWFVVWSMVQFVVWSVRSVVRRNTSCSIQWLPASNAWILVARGLCSFVTFVILRSPDPGPRTSCPQNVVRAASWRRLWGSAQAHAAIVSQFIAFL